MKTSILATLLILTSFTAFPQVKHLVEGQAPGKGNVSDLGWIQGYWTGPGLGGQCEEVWMPALDGHMIGTFRFWNDGKLVFSEFMHLIQEGETLYLKLKHFGADLKPWEEKEEWTVFQLIEMGENVVYFDGLTMMRRSDELVIQLTLNDEENQHAEEFRYQRGEL
ncbi:DUF6265 family protein [Algoriphagus halophytocola]|uniref:DUF6265 family protein n=1 Tax=Algoriphagus halophytocola TaxID=2991499 RepID=A0ABY6MI42_9BACT|nr:DUF6265 family protein [Algoriphagus sp. TR-M5]UZD22087.1 DUF6265 family protein [Algoriphagus sp. TR-M5]